MSNDRAGRMTTLSVADLVELRALVAKLTEGCEPGPWHGVEHGDKAMFGWWLDNPAGDSSFPDPDDVATMLNALPALLDTAGRLGGEHQPGDSHDYRIECRVCGEPGNVVLSVEPQRAGVVGADVRLSDEQTAILRGHLASRQQTASEFFGDVLMEYGLGRATGKQYPPPASAIVPPDPTPKEPT